MPRTRSANGKQKNKVSTRQGDPDQELRGVLEEVADLLDPSSLGTIPSSSLPEAARALGLPTSQASIRRLTLDMAPDSESSISRKRFITILSSRLGISSHGEEASSEEEDEKDPPFSVSASPLSSAPSSPSPSPSTDEPSHDSEYARMLFRLFDQDGKGYINASDIHHVATITKETSLTDEDIKDLLRIASSSSSSSSYPAVSLQDFTKLLVRLRIHDR
ncbi:hypothetical protein BJ684DRAFT_20464 [Piptocephalis cylindrospora]|uniref:EF-hand domain-containing protein n=1 Tax=Piptocephalis cylindrospora TaxID=1907219 RepID=A0A4P9Y2G2_9FUNG|nr:hypothetical protein BJ684DRAFT_20464 [Piptocephalis cylindrospora]|eukprot:RKP13027.1 hypothetical protein BJ684DRAFT_20464 [Piptocephalis cylindrospora]